jgi:hypothetical protein
VVEFPGRGAEEPLLQVAVRAVAPEPPFMGIGMARAAARVEAEEGTLQTAAGFMAQNLRNLELRYVTLLARLVRVLPLQRPTRNLM